MEKDEIKKLGSSEVLNLITSILQNTTGVNTLLRNCQVSRFDSIVCFLPVFSMRGNR